MSDNVTPGDVVTARVGPRELPVSIHRVDTEALPLLMFHGVGAEYERWGSFRDSLNRTTIAFDVRSEHLGRLPSLRKYARFAAAVLSDLGFDRVDVLGLSWGGMLAQQLVRDHPSRVRRLVLASASPGFFSVPAGPLSMLALMSYRRDPANIQNVIKRIYGGDFLENPALAGELGLIRPGDPKTYRRQLRAICGWSSMYWMATIRKSTLILHGDDDPIVPVVNSRIMAQLIPESELIIVRRGGHLFLLTRPQEYAGIVADFLDKNDERGRVWLNRAPDDDGVYPLRLAVDE
jgi:pimeloyl-ACP methyl ester carboxylesterase